MNNHNYLINRMTEEADALCPVEPDEDCFIPSIIRVNCTKCGRTIATIDEGEATERVCYVCANLPLESETHRPLARKSLLSTGFNLLLL